MTIQETIIEALKASQSAHSRALATIGTLRTEKGALEAEVVRLNSHVAHLKAQIAHLESEALKIVEPASVKSLLASLLQVVEETQQATTSPQAAQASQASENVSPSLLSRPILSLQQRLHIDREFATSEAMDAAQ